MTNTKTTKRALLSSVVALFLCFSMLLGTTYAWFTDEVTSANNIIQTGTLKVALEYAQGDEDPASAAWEDASKDAIFDYKYWEPGFVDAKHLRITNIGTLALNYYVRIIADDVVGDLADVIDVYYFENATQLTDRANLANGVKLGTLAEIMGTELNLAKTVKGSLDEEGDIRTLTLALKMQESAGNEYQDLTIANGFKVQLVATQQSYEEDSFGPEYDANVPNPGIPMALVRPLENLKINAGEHVDYGDMEGNIILDTGYNFHPTMGRPDGSDMAGHLPYDPEYTVENSEYRYWHADFVVKADKDVPANSMALAGYYSVFCEGFNDGNWIALTADTDIAAGEEIRLVDAMANGAITVCWDDLCLYGNDGIGFACGAVDLTGENAGTTLTVELYLYETGCDDPGCHHAGKDCEIVGGKSIKVGEFTYTFGINNAEKLEYALTNGGEYKLSGNFQVDKALTVPAGVTTVIDLNGYTITGADNAASGSFGLITNSGNLTIKDSVGTGAITLQAANNRGWNGYSSVISNTVGGKFVLESGTIKHLGGSDMAYAIDNLTNGKGTYAETVINGGTVVSPYRAVRMFLNGTEAQNILTVNGGKIKGDNKSIWMQDPSANANTGNLTVNKDAVLVGDAFLSVTAGSTSWPVTVSINEAALVNGAEVLVNSNVPAGYAVELVDGCYTVVIK